MLCSSGGTGGTGEYPGGGSVAQEDHEGVLRAVVWAGLPDQEPTLTHWRYRQRNPLPPQPQPPHKQRRW